MKISDFQEAKRKNQIKEEFFYTKSFSSQNSSPKDSMLFCS